LFGFCTVLPWRVVTLRKSQDSWCLTCSLCSGFVPRIIHIPYCSFYTSFPPQELSPYQPESPTEQYDRSMRLLLYIIFINLCKTNQLFWFCLNNYYYHYAAVPAWLLLLFIIYIISYYYYYILYIYLFCVSYMHQAHDIIYYHNIYISVLVDYTLFIYFISY